MTPHKKQQNKLYEYATAYWGKQAHTPLSNTPGFAFEKHPKFPLCIFYGECWVKPRVHLSAAARPAGQHCLFRFHLFRWNISLENLGILH